MTHRYGVFERLRRRPVSFWHAAKVVSLLSVANVGLRLWFGASQPPEKLVTELVIAAVAPFVVILPIVLLFWAVVRWVAPITVPAEVELAPPPPIDSFASLPRVRSGEHQ